MAASTRSLIGKVIGGYRLTLLIGMGGMGAVFIGVDPAPADEENHENHKEQPIAIKILVPPMLASDEVIDEFHKRFRREAQMLSSLDHPHILPVHSFGDDEDTGFAYMVMPYISGGTLSNQIQQGSLPFAQTLRYIQQIAAALDHAHKQNIIHRDLKPANVLLDEQDKIYLADFSIAKLFDLSSTALTHTNQVVGTPKYMAPEQVLNKAVSPATDVYGLGVLTYQLLTGQLPFSEEGLLTLLRQIVQEAPPAPHTFRPDLPQQANDILLRALAKDPAERFASAGSFASALERGLQGKAVTLSPESLLIYTTEPMRAASAQKHETTGDEAALHVEEGVSNTDDITPVAANRVHPPEESAEHTPQRGATVPAEEDILLSKQVREPEDASTAEESAPLTEQTHEHAIISPAQEEMLALAARTTVDNALIDISKVPTLDTTPQARTVEEHMSSAEKGNRDGFPLLPKERTDVDDGDSGYIARRAAIPVKQPDGLPALSPGVVRVVGRRSRKHQSLWLVTVLLVLVLLITSGGLFALYSNGTTPAAGKSASRTAKQVDTPGAKPATTPAIVPATMPTIAPVATPIIAPTSTLTLNPVPGASLATVTLTPDSRVVQNTFAVTAVTRTPDAKQGQVQSRWASATSQPQSKTVNATGTGVVPATSAVGSIKVTNLSLNVALNFSVGDAIHEQGVPVGVVLDAPVSLPKATNTNTPSAVVHAHIVETGTRGNLPASQLIFPGNCSPGGPGDCWRLDATTPFTGGTDPQNYTFVQQSDIDSATSGLPASPSDPQQVVQGQAYSNERAIGAPSCQPNTTPNHNANDKASSVTVTRTFTCKVVVYDLDGALLAAQAMLQSQASSNPGNGYALTGAITRTPQGAQITDAAQGTVKILVAASGTWIYQVDDGQKQAIAKGLAGKKKADAQDWLKGQQGITGADIELSDGDKNTFPADANTIKVVIAGT